MQLHHHPLSTCSRRVLMTAHHLGIELDLVPVDLTKGEQKSPAFLKLNPNGRVPVLEHGGFVLWESCAIMQYLADQTAQQTIYPPEPRLRADVNRWLFWCGQNLMPGIAILNWENAIKAMIGLGPAEASEVARGERLFTEAASLLDAQLAHSDWVCAQGLSLADFAIAAPLADEDRARLPMRGSVHLQRWLQQMRALHAWQQTER